MATVLRRGKKGIYTAMWRDAAGKQWSRTTHSKDRKVAQSMADDWEKVAQLPAQMRTIQHMQRVMGEIHRRFTGQMVSRVTLKAYTQSWLGLIKHQIGDISLVSYTYVTDKFLEDMTAEGRGDVVLDEVTKPDILHWRDSRRKKVGAVTVNREMTILHSMFRQAKEDGAIVEDPMETVKPVKVNKKDRHSPKPYSNAQLSQIIEVCDPEWESMVVHGYYTGQRLKDIALMIEEQVDVAKRQVKFVTGKTGTVVIIEMPEPYLNWFLARTSSDNPKAFLHPEAAKAIQRSKRGQVGTLSNQFARLLWKAGLREEKPSHRKKKDGDGTERRKQHSFKFHSLRHTMISDLAEGGVDRSLVQDMVGHRSAAVNQIYTHFKPKTKRDAMEHLHDLTKKAPTSQLTFIDGLDKDGKRKP